MTPLQNARRQRRNMSPAEVRLWLVLRERPHGFKFRRQRPNDPFVLDFFCKAAGLAIEVDGDAHDFEDRAEADERRDARLAALNIKTLRIPAAEIMANVDGAVRGILEECALRAPPPPPCGRSPSPRNRGED